jgi:hypothetical protein
VSSNDPDDSACRVCGRSALAHPSGACRSCRRGKPDNWVAKKKPVAKPAASVLTKDEKTPAPRGWMERNREAWKRRQEREKGS